MVFTDWKCRTVSIEGDNYPAGPMHLMAILPLNAMNESETAGAYVALDDEDGIDKCQ